MILRLLAVVALLVAVPSARADATAPSVRVEPTAVAVGGRVIVTMSNWPKRRPVTVSVCGNNGLRGSLDCNVTESTGLDISEFENDVVTELLVSAPPVPCPCVVRVANASQSLVVNAPIEIAGVPMATVVSGRAESRLRVSASVRRAHVGLLDWLKSSLGGPTAYELDVVLRNDTAEAMENVMVRGSAGRTRSDQSRLIELRAPSTLAPGSSWAHTERVTLSAPVVGEFHWNLTALGAGESDRVALRSSHRPLLLFVVVAFVAADLLWLVFRRRSPWVNRGDRRVRNSPAS